jgi:arabinogalactan oligomer/maltooligosaccharide transport system substrate-binding protein
MLSTRTLRRLAGLLVVAALSAVVLTSTATSAESAKIRIWTDKDRKPAVEKVAGAWAAEKGISVEVVEKDFGKIRDDLKTVQADTAPDVIVGAHDWTGQLAADGLVLPLYPTKAVRSEFPAYALDAFSYGTAVKKLYAAPVALENIGLVVNLKLAHAPKSFDDLKAQALKFQKKAAGNIGLAVPQGANGDAYHMYPFFSGLCGYIFGKNRAGNLDPSDIGVANPKFLKNAGLVDSWNASGFLNSKIDYGIGKDAFLKGKAAFWITGPWESDTLKQSGLKYTITGFPAIKCKSVPFLGAQGFFVTKFATAHGIENGARDLVGEYMMHADAQAALAAANGRFPANLKAGKQVNDPVLKLFGKASVGGVPMPNIPQMSSVWSELGGAWVKSTKGKGATHAKVAFSVASRNIANKIG